MDPAIDRLYIAATLIVLLLRHVVPLWMVIILFGRDVILGVMTLAMARVGIAPFTVTYMGKAATFNLLYAFPFLLLGLSRSTWGTVSFVLGWSFALWGVALYVATGADYLRTGWRNLRLSK